MTSYQEKLAQLEEWEMEKKQANYFCEVFDKALEKTRLDTPRQITVRMSRYAVEKLAPAKAHDCISTVLRARGFPGVYLICDLTHGDTCVYEITF
jgi:hypothetical protein